MEKVVSAIVLDSKPYKEDHVQLLLLTNTDDKMYAICKGVKKSTSKLKTLASPFCFAEYTLNIKNQCQIIGGHLYDTFFSISKNYIAYLCANCMCALLRSSQSAQANFSSLFIPAVNSLKSWCYSDINPKAVLAYFLIKYLECIGYKLNLETCATCSEKLNKCFINVSSGECVCEKCQELYCFPLNDNQVEFIKNSLNDNIENLDDLNSVALLKILGNTIYSLTEIKILLNEILNISN